MDMFSIAAEDAYDVVVIGGGTAGVAAAISASKEGKKTVIIETQGFLGGMSTGGMISQYMGFADGVTTENVTGVMGDILNRLWKRGAAAPIETIYLLYRKDLDVKAAAYDSEMAKVVLDELVQEANVSVLFHTKAVAVECGTEGISAVLVHNTQGVTRIKGKVFIDATFHGTIATQAGCHWVKGDEKGTMQPGTLMFRLINVDMERFNALSFEEKRALGQQGAAEGALFTNAILCRPIYPGLSYCNMSRVTVDATDVQDWSRAEMEGRKQISKIMPFLKKSVPGFEHAELAGMGTYLGLRDSRRIVGNHCLTAQEILRSQAFDDYVAVSSYPIDIHDANGIDSIIQKPKHGNYYIPYRCMTTDIPNLIVTGRCISTDHAAHAAIRVMSTCTQLGEAAGVAAAKSLDLNVAPNCLDGTIVTKALFG